jgi:hypothetical protein
MVRSGGLMEKKDCTVILNPIRMAPRAANLNQLYERVMDTRVHDPKVKDLIFSLMKFAKLKGGGL